MAPIEWTSALLVADRDQNKAQWARTMRNRKMPHIFETSDELAALLAGLLRSARDGKHVVLAGQGTAASMKAALPAAIALTGSDGIRFSMHAVNADRARSVDLVNGGAPLAMTVPLCDTRGNVVTSGAELQLAAGGLDAAKAAHGASGFNVLAMIALDGDGSRLGSLVMIESKKPMPQLMSALGAKAQLMGTDAVVLRTLLKNIPITLGILIAGVSAAGDRKSIERLECLAALDAPRMGSRDAQLLIGKKLRMPLQQCASAAERQREHQAAVVLQRAARLLSLPRRTRRLAAIAVQAAARGLFVRRSLQRVQRNHEAVVVVQTAFRRHAARRLLARARARVVALQATARRLLAQRVRLRAVAEEAEAKKKAAAEAEAKAAAIVREEYERTAALGFARAIQARRCAEECLERARACIDFDWFLKAGRLCDRAAAECPELPGLASLRAEIDYAQRRAERCEPRVAVETLSAAAMKMQTAFRRHAARCLLAQARAMAVALQAAARRLLAHRARAAAAEAEAKKKAVAEAVAKAAAEAEAHARAETARLSNEQAANEWLGKAAEALDRGDLDRAGRMCDKAEAKLPGLPGLPSLRAAIHEAANRPSPEVVSLLSSARAALLSGDVARAREEVARAAQRQPACSLVQTELALIDATSPEALRVINNKTFPHIALGIDRTAPPPTVRKAYKKLALKLHPDKGNHPILEAAFKALHAAYEKITHSPAYQVQL